MYEVGVVSNYITLVPNLVKISQFVQKSKGGGHTHSMMIS